MGSAHWTFPIPQMSEIGPNDNPLLPPQQQQHTHTHTHNLPTQIQSSIHCQNSEYCTHS
jgi:hypothetical protein